MNTTKLQAAAILVLVFGVALMTRALFPRTVTVHAPPRIVTLYDTVPGAALDTEWVPNVIHDTVKAPALPPEKVTVTETVYVARVPPLVGMTTLSMAATVGDSSLVAGFTVTPADSGGYNLRRFSNQYYTAGPLKAVFLEHGIPRLTFYDPPPPSCLTGCRIKDYATGMGIGAGIVTLLFTLFGHH